MPLSRFCRNSNPSNLQLAYADASGVEPAEVSRMVHSLETNAEGWVCFREAAALLFSGGGGGGSVVR